MSALGILKCQNIEFDAKDTVIALNGIRIPVTLLVFKSAKRSFILEDYDAFGRYCERSILRNWLCVS